MRLTFRTAPVLLAWAASAPLLCALPGPAASQPARAPWRTPPARLRTEAGDAVYVDQPRAARVGGRVALFGFPTVAMGPTGVTAVGAGVTLLPGRVARVIPLPPGQRRFRSPAVIAAAAAGRGSPVVAHVVWSGRDTPEGAQPDTLWYAQWDGARWSTPTRVWSGPGLYWRQDVASDLLADAGRLSLFAPYVGSDTTRSWAVALMHLERSTAGWRATPVPLRAARPLQVVARGTPGHAGHVVAYVAAEQLPGDPPAAPSPTGGLAMYDRNSVIAGWLASGSSTLTDLRRVHAGLAAPASNLVIGPGPGRTVSLAWTYEPAEGAGDRRLAFATTGDGGRHWAAHGALDLGGAADRLRVTAPDTGALTLTLHVARTDTSPSAADGTDPDGCTAAPGAATTVAVATLGARGRWRVAPVPAAGMTTAVAFAEDRGRTLLWTGGRDRAGVPYSCVAGL